MPGPNQASTYSFKDTSGGFNDALAGPFAFGGQIGAGRFIIEMHTDRTVMDVAADGLVLPSAVAGNNGSLTIEMQQTSVFHKFLLNWFNLLNQAFDNADVSDWAGATISLVNTVDGSTHTLTGVAPTKIPNKSYGPQAERISWILMCANIVNG
jgi:hypothetical protein